MLGTIREYAHKTSVIKIHMLRWMCDKIRKDKIRDKGTRGSLGIIPIENKIRERRLTWYIVMRSPTAATKRC